MAVHIRPVGRSYKQLIADWNEVLPTQSVCLSVPIVLPSEYDTRVPVRQRQGARDLLAAEEDGTGDF